LIAFRRHWQAVLTLLSAILVAGAIYGTSFFFETKETDSQVAAWELTVAQLYGMQIDDFSPLGEGGLYFEWIDPEDSDLFCTQSQSCNIIRLANVISCPHGFRVSYDFLDGEDRVLSKHLSNTTYVPLGTFTLMEIDTEKLPESGSLFLKGAECQSEYSPE
jgi:hypothetical protein